MGGYFRIVPVTINNNNNNTTSPIQPQANVCCRWFKNTSTEYLCVTHSFLSGFRSPCLVVVAVAATITCHQFAPDILPLARQEPTTCRYIFSLKSGGFVHRISNWNSKFNSGTHSAVGWMTSYFVYYSSLLNGRLDG